MAKFKVGDKVRDKYGKHSGGVVTKVTPTDIYVDFGDGTVGTYGENDLVAANSTCHNAKVPEIGDFVETRDSARIRKVVQSDNDPILPSFLLLDPNGSKKWYKFGEVISHGKKPWIGAEGLFKNSTCTNAIAHHNFKVDDYVGMQGVYPAADVKMKVTKVDGDKIYCDGEPDVWEPRDLHYWTAKNAVVANALAWKAKVVSNAKFKVGDKIRTSGNFLGVEEGEVFKIVSVDKNISGKPTYECRSTTNPSKYIDLVEGLDEIRIANAEVVENAGIDNMTFFNQGQRQRDEFFKMRDRVCNELQELEMKAVSIADDYENANADFAKNPEGISDVNKKVAKLMEPRYYDITHQIRDMRKKISTLG